MNILLSSHSSYLVLYEFLVNSTDARLSVTPPSRNKNCYYYKVNGKRVIWNTEFLRSEQRITKWSIKEGNNTLTKSTTGDGVNLGENYNTRIYKLRNRLVSHMFMGGKDVLTDNRKNLFLLKLIKINIYLLLWTHIEYSAFANIFTYLGDYNDCKH